QVEALYQSRRDSARASVDESDVRFMTAMLMHHVEGRAMFELAARRSDSRDVQLLANRLFRNYEDEIAAISTWLRDHDQPMPEPFAHPPVPADSLLLISNPSGIPTPQQMEQLENASREHFDRLLMTLAVQHHS